jgi:hypothetical protein
VAEAVAEAVAAGAGDAVAASAEAVTNVVTAGVGEGVTTGVEAVTGVAVAVALPIPGLTDSEGTPLSIGWNGEDKPLLGDLCMIGWEGAVFEDGLAGRGFIQDKRLFF